MLTSIVIPTYNRKDLTVNCLNSIMTKITEPYEVIVVDNGSSDGTREYLKKQPNLKLILNDCNYGFPKACNQGINLATGDNILILNNDTIVTRNFLKNMLRALYSDPTIAFVGPTSNNVNGIQQIPVNYSNVSEIDRYAEHHEEKFSKQVKRTVRLVGFCMLIKRSSLEDIGLFDESFGLGYFEDDDLCLRAVNKGYKLIVAVDAFVHHFRNGTIGTMDVDFQKVFTASQSRIHEKWPFNFPHDTMPNMPLINMVPLDSETILEVGCKTGATGIELMNRQDCRMFGWEFRRGDAELARKFYSHVCSSTVTDNNILPYSDQFFDTVLLSESLFYVKNPRKVVQMLKRPLKIGGSMVMALPSVAYRDKALMIPRPKYGRLENASLKFIDKSALTGLFSGQDFSVSEKTEQTLGAREWSEGISDLLTQFTFSSNATDDIGMKDLFITATRRL